MSKLDTRTAKPSTPRLPTSFRGPNRDGAVEQPPTPVIQTRSAAEQRQVLGAMSSAAGKNRVAIFKDDFKGSLNLKAEGQAKRTVELDGSQFEVLTQGTLESKSRKVGQRLSLDQTLTRAGYDVSKLDPEQKLKLMDALNRKAEVQLGREAGKWLNGVAAHGKDGSFSTRITAVNGQTYLVTAKTNFDDAIRNERAGNNVGWSDWADRGVIPDKAEVEYTGRDNDRKVVTRWDRAESALRLEEREKKFEPIIQKLKFEALFSDGDAKARAGVEGIKGAWDFDVEVEKFEFAATRVKKDLFNGDTADFLKELVRAHTANASGAAASKGETLQALRKELGGEQWKQVRALVERVAPALPPNPTDEQLKTALKALTPEERKLLRGAEHGFFKEQLDLQQVEMMQEAVLGERPSVRRSFVFGDKKYELKLQAEFEVDVSRVKAPLFNRALSALGMTVGLVGGFAVGAAFLAGASNAMAISAAVAGSQAVLGGVNALSSGDFKGFALNLLSAAGSGMFGTGGFQQFASTASRIAGGVDNVVSGKNFFEKMSGVASLAGFALDKAGAARWAKNFDYVSKAANLGSAAVEKDVLGLFTAAMAVANGELGDRYANRQRAAMAEALSNAVSNAAIRPFGQAETQALLGNMEALDTAVDNGMVSVMRPDGSWQKMTQAKVAAVKQEFGSVRKWAQAEDVRFGLQVLPDDVLRSLSSRQNQTGGRPAFTPMQPSQIQGLLDQAARGQLELRFHDGVRIRPPTQKELSSWVKNADAFNALLKGGKLTGLKGGKELSNERLIQAANTGAQRAVNSAADYVAQRGFSVQSFVDAVAWGRAHQMDSGDLIAELFRRDGVRATAMLYSASGGGITDSVHPTVRDAMVSLSQAQMEQVLRSSAQVSQLTNAGIQLPVNPGTPIDGGSIIGRFYLGSGHENRLVSAALNALRAPQNGNRLNCASAALIASQNNPSFLSMTLGAIERQNALTGSNASQRLNVDTLASSRPQAMALGLAAAREQGVRVPDSVVLGAVSAGAQGGPNHPLSVEAYNALRPNMVRVLRSDYMTDTERTNDYINHITTLLVNNGAFTAEGYTELMAPNGPMDVLLNTRDWSGRNYNERVENAERSASAVATAINIIHRGLHMTQERGNSRVDMAANGLNILMTLADISLPPLAGIVADQAGSFVNSIRSQLNGGDSVEKADNMLGDLLDRLLATSSYPQNVESQAFINRLNRLTQHLPI